MRLFLSAALLVSWTAYGLSCKKGDKSWTFEEGSFASDEKASLVVFRQGDKKVKVPIIGAVLPTKDLVGEFSFTSDTQGIQVRLKKSESQFSFTLYAVHSIEVNDTNYGSILDPDLDLADTAGALTVTCL